MTLVPFPVVGPFASWTQRDEHLVDFHGISGQMVDQLDSDEARAYHAYLHLNAEPARRHVHRGGV